ncbi:MAG: hypothetical protein IPP71_03635 [Bacteroidetes bacterium]|nr:hypothetical protein [Bacteroidota bacterium]
MKSSNCCIYKFSATNESWSDLLTLLPADQIASYNITHIQSGFMDVKLELCSCSKSLLQWYMMQIIGGLKMLQTLKILPVHAMKS